jgi:hypothetical protein
MHDDKSDKELMTPWKRAKRLSQMQEKRFGKAPGSRQQLNSGRTWFSKRDNRRYDFLVENRTTEKRETRKYCLNVDELKKLCQDAIFHHSIPAMNIEFPFDYQNWMLIQTTVFDSMVEHIGELQAEITSIKRENA